MQAAVSAFWLFTRLQNSFNLCGAYNFCAGQCFVWKEGSCNKELTIQFFHNATKWLEGKPGPVLIIQDGASRH